MPYIGNPSAQRFTSPRAASVFSGDGSTTAFTLEEAVSTDEDILVSVDGVIQEPSVAYAVSNGTTLTFTAAPSSNSGNNIFVYYIARTLGSVSMPDGQNVNAATGSFSGTLNVTGDGTFSTSLDVTNNLGVGVSPTTSYGRVTQIHDTGTSGANLRLTDSTSGSGTGNGFEIIQIGVNNYMINRETGFISLYTSNAEALKIDSAGHVTKPKQPAFYAETASTQSNLATGSAQTLAFGVEIFDQNADFASNTFTAPVSGRYFLHTTLRFEAIDTAATYILWGIVTSNRQFYSILDPQRFSADVNYYSVQQTVLADMDASDTAHVVYLQSGGTAQTDLQGADGYSYFCGHLVA